MVSKTQSIGIVALIAVVAVLFFGKPFGLYQVGGSTFALVSAPDTAPVCGNNVCEMPWESTCSDCTIQHPITCGEWVRQLDNSIHITCDDPGYGLATEWVVTQQQYDANVVCTPTTTACGEWSVCNAENKQTRSCDDGCIVTIGEQICGEACVPSTTCGDWTQCDGEIEERVCNDGCGTTNIESRSCGFQGSNYYDREASCTAVTLETNMPDGTRYFDTYEECINYAPIIIPEENVGWIMWAILLAVAGFLGWAYMKSRD